MTWKALLRKTVPLEGIGGSWRVRVVDRFRMRSTGLGGLALLAVALASCGGPTSSSSSPASPLHATVGANVPATPADALSLQQPSLASSPTNGRLMAIAYEAGSIYNSALCGLSLSHDGGATWTPASLVGLGGRIALPVGFDVCADPKVAYGPRGALYYAYQAESTKTFASYVLLATSMDGGQTFGRPVVVDSAVTLASGAGADWYPAVAVDPRSGEIDAAWFSFGSGNDSDTFTAHSSDSGRTFSTPVRLNSAERATTFNTGIAVGPDGGVYVGWVDDTANISGCGTTPKSYLCAAAFLVSASHDGGRSFSPSVVDSQLNLGCPGPAVLAQILHATFKGRCDPLHFGGYAFSLPVAAGASSGAVFAAWWDGDPQSPARIHLSASTDGGRSWKAAAQLPAPANADDQQSRPALSVAASGRIDVVYYQQTASGSVDTYLTWSTTGGSSFSSPVRISDASSDSRVGPPNYNGITLGEFLGVVTGDTSDAVAWTDTRRGTVGNAKQDVYTAHVRF